MALSDGAGIPTGYATISRKLLNYLSSLGWECHFLEHTGVHQTYMPGTKLEDGEEFKFHLHGSGMQPYCQDLIMPKIRELKPDVFGILLDSFMTFPWLLNIDFAPAKSVFYFPSDGGGKLENGIFKPGKIGPNLPLNCDQILKKVDVSVGMAMFAQQHSAQYGINSKYIPHAVETEIYTPLTEQERQMLKAKWGLKNKFVIGVVARNQGRKMLDRTFLAMQKIAKEIPEAVLLCHTDKTDPASYFNSDYLIQQLGIGNRVIFTGVKYTKGFDYKQMNEIYNLMDIFLLGTSGEGFGIPIIEAMSACIPVLVTDYTTTWEIVERNNAGESIKVSDEILGTWNVGRAIIDIEDCADKVIKLYKNPQLRKEYGLNGRQAVLRDYNWPTVSRQWDVLLRELIKN